jgi:hypothetical protein
LGYDRFLPIERWDLLDRIRGSRVRVDGLHEIVVKEFELDGLLGKSVFDPVRSLYAIILSPSTFGFLKRNNPKGAWTLVHEFSHVWLHHRYLEKLSRLEKQSRAGDRGARQTLDDKLSWRSHQVRFDSDSQADTLTANFLMPAEGVKLLQTEERSPLTSGMIARHFNISDQSAGFRLINYNKHKEVLLGDTLRYDSSTHRTVLRDGWSNRAASETGADETFFKSQIA